MKPAVSKARHPMYGLFGAEYHWEIYLGLVRIGTMRAWADAVAAANAVSRTSIGSDT